MSSPIGSLYGGLTFCRIGILGLFIQLPANIVDTRFDIGPAEMLGYINNAEYVVTDSFHGPSISLIFQKRVITYIALQHSASRITSIMSSLGISNQIITDITAFNIENICFNNYKDKLVQFVNSSKEYLQTTLK